MTGGQPGGVGQAGRRGVMGRSLVGLVDRGLDQLYARLGWRVILAYQVGSWVAGLAFGLAAAGYFAYLVELPWSAGLRLVGLTAVVWLLAVSLATFWSVRTAGPLIRWYRDGCDARHAADAWVLALRLPQQFSTWNLLAGFLVVPAGMCVAIALVGPMDLDDYAATVTGSIGAMVTGGVAGIVTGQLVLRPLVRDIGSRLSHRPPLPDGITVRRKLLLLVPFLMVVVGISTPLLVHEPGAPFDGLLYRMPVIAVVVILGGVPMALLLAASTLQPLTDLLAGTERVKHGDYATPVPELSADEHGLLARSFNEAMQGLVERQQLAAENERLLDEARESRARIVAASDAERRRVERNIHDGAQQRLVALTLRLRMLQERPDLDHDVRAEVTGSVADLSEALEELRELARGLHPSVLSTDGLAPALEQLAGTAPLPVDVDAPRDRFADTLESTLYYIASEGIANIVKYARATRARIVVTPQSDHVAVEVADDGIGGAVVGTGTGLAGLVDRVEAVGGRLEVDSPPGAGTILRAHVPLDERRTP